MTLLRHDGTFEGFLTCLDRALGTEFQECRITASGSPGELSFEECIDVPSDEQRAEAIRGKLQRVCGPEPLRSLALAFLVCDDHRDEILFAFARSALRWGRSTLDHLEDPAVLQTNRLAEAPLKEAHKYKGILRFRELRDHTFYAPIEPRHHILPLLAGHFAARMPGMNWVIHDLKRGQALYHRDGETNLVAIAFAPEVPALPHPDGGPELSAQSAGPPPGAHEDLSRRTEVLSPEEALYQELWKLYFSSVAIRERTNPRLQMQHLPKKTWKHLVETPGRPRPAR